MPVRFADRAAAGRALAQSLLGYRCQPDVVVLALPRGGVPVAFEIALALEAPLDVLVVRKLGVPGDEELAFGAIATGGVRVLNPDVIAELRIPARSIEEISRREGLEVSRRESLLRGSVLRREINGRRVILVDDGLATGSSMRAAIAALRPWRPSRIVVAVPVAPRSIREELAGEVDEVVCSVMAESFFAIGDWYEDFIPTTDEQVRELLQRAARELQARGQVVECGQDASR